MKVGQNVIVIWNEDAVEVWGTITDIAKTHPEFSYSTLKSKKFPFTYKGWRFVKVKYKSKAI